MISRCTSYEEIINVITLFDRVISGRIGYKPKSSLLSTSLKILDHLFFSKDKDKFDHFIYQTFEFFAQNKTDFFFDLMDLYKNMSDSSSKFLGFIFDGNGLQKETYDNDNYIIYDDNTNLIKKEMFDVFPNAKLIHLSHVQYQNDYFSFSLLKLLELIKEINIEEVTIVADIEKGGTSWLSNLWLASPSLVKAFKNEDYTIEFTRVCSDTIFIKKVQ